MYKIIFKKFLIIFLLFLFIYFLYYNLDLYKNKSKISNFYTANQNIPVELIYNMYKIEEISGVVTNLIKDDNKISFNIEPKSYTNNLSPQTLQNNNINEKIEINLTDNIKGVYIVGKFINGQGDNSLPTENSTPSYYELKESSVSNLFSEITNIDYIYIKYIYPKVNSLNNSFIEAIVYENKK